MDLPQPFNRLKFTLQISLLIILTIFSGLVSLSIGSVDISIREIINTLFTNNSSEQLNKIIFEVRLPRILFAIIIGGGLSITGAVFQSILMNPLAEPYILGISSGGTFGAVLSLMIGLPFLGTQTLAFIGAFLVMLLVFFLGRRFGDLEPNILILSGVMIGAFFSALILMMIILLNESLRTAVFWMVGSLSFIRIEYLPLVTFIVICVSVFLVINSYKYNILTLGTETAISLGIKYSSLKTSTYFLASILIGSVVSVSGIIGFVGLLIPHICRLIWGMDNRIIIPFSFFVGAIYLTLSDTFARTIISPSEVPVGAVTALIGAPFFIYLLRTRFTMK